jgi:hypothetical protein
MRLPSRPDRFVEVALLQVRPHLGANVTAGRYSDGLSSNRHAHSCARKAVSFFGGFRTTPPVPATSSVLAVIPNPAQTGTLLPCLHSASIGAAITPAPNMLRTPWKNPSLSRPHRPRLRPCNDPWKLRTGMSFDREIVALLRTSKSRELTPRGVRRSASTKGRHSLRPCLPEKKKFPLTATVAPATRCGPRRLASARLRRRITPSLDGAALLFDFAGPADLLDVLTFRRSLPETLFSQEARAKSHSVAQCERT